jgi:hypothetical protein
MRYALVAGFGMLVLLSFTVTAAGEVKKVKQLPELAKAILDKSSEISLYSLDPEAKADKENELHGWKVLGKTTVKEAEARNKLLSALEKSIAEPGRGGFKCFDPRHAIRATHDGKSVDLVICFECGWVYVYIDGKAAAHLEMDTVAQPPFDDVLLKAKVPLAKKPKE